MKYLSIMLLFALLLAACESPAPIPIPPSSENVSAEDIAPSSAAAIDSSSTSQAEVAASSLFSAWQPPEKPRAELVASADFWAGRYLYDIINGYPATYRFGDLMPDSSDIYGSVCSRLVRAGASERMPQTVDSYGIKYIELELDEYLLLVKHMYGGNNTGVEESANAPWLSNRIDRENKKILMNIYYDEAQEKRNSAQYVLTEIIPLADNGVDKVQLTVERRSENNFTITENILIYDLFWDDQVGYVPQEITPKPANNQIVIDGNVKTFPSLWGGSANEDSYTTANMNFGYIVKLVTVGETVYRFHLNESALSADILNLETMEQSTNQLIHHFDSEKINGLRNGKNGLLVNTDTAVYLLDDNLEIKKRKPWPKKLYEDKPEKSALILSDDISLVAYAKEDGIYLCEIKENAVPVLLQKHPAPESDNVVDYKFMYPICFAGNNRLFAGVEMWERIAYYRVIDLKGNTLDEIPLTVTGIFAGGYCEYNQAGAIYFDPLTQPERESANYYYDFENGRLEQADWLKVSYNDYMYQCLPNPRQSNLWYAYAPQESYGQPQNPIFMLMDFKAGALSQMPLAVTGANATMLAASGGGRILFSYTNANESGFGVYYPG